MKLKVKPVAIRPAELVAEFLGTFGLTFAVLSAINAQGGALQVAQATSFDGGIQPVAAYLLTTPFVAAATLGLFVMTIGAISGSHINPAITLGLWSIRKVEAVKAVAYILFQLLGALVALGVAGLFTTAVDLSQFTVSADWYVFAAEALGAMIFGFGVAAAVLNKKSGHEAAVMVGGSLLLGIIFATFAVGAGILNPAVMLGLQSVSWSHAVGPIVGSIVGMNLYQLLLSKPMQTAVKTK